MGTDNTCGETNFNTEKMTQLELDYIKSLKDYIKIVDDIIGNWEMSNIRLNKIRQKISELEKQVQFEMLCDPDIYEASANEHFEREVKKELLMNFRKYFNSANYGHIDESDVDGFIDTITENWIE